MLKLKRFIVAVYAFVLFGFRAMWKVKDFSPKAIKTAWVAARLLAISSIKQKGEPND